MYIFLIVSFIFIINSSMFTGTKADNSFSVSQVEHVGIYWLEVGEVAHPLITYVMQVCFTRNNLKPLGNHIFYGYLD